MRWITFALGVIVGITLMAGVIHLLLRTSLD